MRSRACLLALLAAVLGGSCREAPVTVVQISGLPPAARSLRVIAKLDDLAEKELPPLDLGEHAGQPAVTLGIRVPDGYDGRVLAVAAVYGDGGCLVATGSGEVRGGPGAQVNLPVQELGTPECSGKTPILIDVQPRAVPTTGEAMVTIHGWGFRPGASVSINNVAAGTVSVRSSVEILADVPNPPRPLGRVPIIVANPDGSRDRREDLFHYKASQLKFTSTILTLNLPNPYEVVAGDLDGDGWQDLVVRCQRSGSAERTGISVLKNRRDGTFAVTDYPMWQTARISIAEMDGVKGADLAFLSKDEVPTVLFNKGDGTFARDTSDVDYAQYPPWVNELAVGDINGDRLGDLMTIRIDGVQDPRRGEVRLLLNGGQRMFAASRGPYFFDREFTVVNDGMMFGFDAARLEPRLVDISHSGIKDLIIFADFRYAPGCSSATFRCPRGGFYVLKQVGGAEFEKNSSSPYFDSFNPWSSALADLDGDGWLDVMRFHFDHFSWFLNRRGTFEHVQKDLQESALPYQRANVGAHLLADVNGDERPDVVSPYSDADLQMSLNLGDGTFAPVVSVQIADLAAVSHFVNLNDIAVDLNNDGLQDLVFAGGDKLVLVTNQSE